MGLQFSTQEAVPLVEDWDISNCFTVQDGILYWAVTGDGVYSMDMEKKSVTKHRSFDPVWNMAPRHTMISISI